MIILMKHVIAQPILLIESLGNQKNRRCQTKGIWDIASGKSLRKMDNCYLFYFLFILFILFSIYLMLT